MTADKLRIVRLKVTNSPIKIEFRFAQISQAVKQCGQLKDCSPAQFQSLCDMLYKTRLLELVAGFQ